jgi:transposase
MAPISIKKENQIKDLLYSKYSYRGIAKKVKVSKSSVSRIAKKFNLCNKNNLGGRPKSLSSHDKSFCIHELTKGLKDTAVEVKKSVNQLLNKSVSNSTVRHALQVAGLSGKFTIEKPFLTGKHIKARLKWAKQHQYWTIDDWKRVIW